MLEKPDLDEAYIRERVQDVYGLRVAQVAFLPLGADLNTAVYQVASDQATYFLKLRRGHFDPVSVALPRWLSDQGIPHLIAPLSTAAGHLWAGLGAFTAVLYPFVAGSDGYAVALSDDHWRAIGATIRRIHAAAPPPDLVRGLPRERYSPQWRDSVLEYLERAGAESFGEPVAAQVAALLREHEPTIRDLVGSAGQLAGGLQASAPADTICHGDLHAGNFLIDDHGALYIVDWDTLILAPKERDLMYVGAGLTGGWRTPADEHALFYQGYGQTPIDQAALAYYRYERIVQDIAAYCDQLLLSDEGGDDRPLALHYLRSNFTPDGTIAIARAADQAGPV